MFVGQVIDDVAPFVNLATLDEPRFAGMLAHGCGERFASIEDVKPRRREVQAALHQLTQQRTYHRSILRRAFANAQHGFCSIAANPKGGDHLPVLERRAIDDDGAQTQLAQRTLHQLLHLFAAGFDEVFAHRRLLYAIGVVKVLHHRPVVARRKTAHHLVPHTQLHWPAALEQFVAAQALLPFIGRAQPRLADRHLLAVHHAVAVLFAPAVSATALMLLVAISGQVPDFFFHYRLHQGQSCFAHQVAHALL